MPSRHVTARAARQAPQLVTSRHVIVAGHHDPAVEVAPEFIDNDLVKQPPNSASTANTTPAGLSDLEMTTLEPGSDLTKCLDQIGRRQRQPCFLLAQFRATS